MSTRERCLKSFNELCRVKWRLSYMQRQGWQPASFGDWCQGCPTITQALSLIGIYFSNQVSYTSLKDISISQFLILVSRSVKTCACIFSSFEFCMITNHCFISVDVSGRLQRECVKSIHSHRTVSGPFAKHVSTILYSAYRVR